MITPEMKQEITRALIRRIGESYREPRGCLLFLQSAMAMLGINMTMNVLADAHNFYKVDKPDFGDVVVFKGVPLYGDKDIFHVAFALDDRWAIQSSRATNGVARIDLTRDIFKPFIKRIGRLKQLCS
jgi:hypothetical protein